MNKTDKIIHGLTTDEERALYGLSNTTVENCTFIGPADGESALKECRNIRVTGCSFSLRYPLWHVENYSVENSSMDVNARAAVWYSNNGIFKDCNLGGIKVFRECMNTVVENCKISSFESGWHCTGFEMSNCEVLSEYFLLGSKDVKIKDCVIEGKYPMQYLENAVIDNCKIKFKDCLWHAKNVTVKNSVLSGEYLAWYSENLTLENCLIDGTQPLCYCKGLKLINCRTKDCDLAFELSEIDADIKGKVLSIRSPLSGTIVCDGAGEIVEDVTEVYPCNAQIIIRK